jgi:DNA polymerase III subunit epsilon
MEWWKMISGSNNHKEDFVRDYESLFKEKTSPKTPVDQLNFTILDTETTGLEPKKDYILSFGAVKLKTWQISVSSSMELYLQAPFKRTSALGVHEIIENQNSLTLMEFAKKVLPYLGNSILVGHHIDFDVAMLEKTFRPFGLSKLLNPTLDTLDLAVRLEKGIYYDPMLIRGEQYSLDALCQRYEIPLDDRHTAAGDAFLTAQLLLKLLKLLELKGITNYKSLIK